MILITPQILFFLEVLLYLTVVLMHLAKKNSAVILLYAVQSFIIFFFLLKTTIDDFSYLSLVVALGIFAVKVVLAPYFFRNMIEKNHFKFSVSTYLNTPLTFVVLAVLTAITNSHFFQPLTIIAPENANAILLALAMVFISIFLLINRRGALSQVVGVLSLENAIVSLAFLAGLEQSPVIQLGIIFVIIIWLIIAFSFTSMIYKQFNSLDVSKMKHLKEE